MIFPSLFLYRYISCVNICQNKNESSSHDKQKEELKSKYFGKRKNMRKKIFAYGIMLLMISTCTLQLMSRQNNIFKIASQGEGEGEFLTNNNLNQKKVYLTFDDGPSDHTAEILDILKKNKVKATSFWHVLSLSLQQKMWL